MLAIPDEKNGAVVLFCIAVFATVTITSTINECFPTDGKESGSQDLAVSFSAKCFLGDDEGNGNHSSYIIR